MKNFLAIFLVFAFFFSNAFADVSGGPVLIYDSSGNSLNSTSNALNVFVNNSSLAVTGTFWQTTQPVSGTVTANQGGSWAVTANAGTGTFQTNVTNSSIPVTQSGSWAITANAGTNLNTSLLALDTSVNGILLAQGSTTSGEKGPLMLGAVTTSAPTYVTTQTSPLSLTTAGALRVDASGTTQPISGSVSVSNFPATQAVTQSTSPWVVSGTVTANAGTGTFAISAASLPLPSGASTSALQTTANTSLATLVANSPALGQALMASSVPVVIASNQSAIPVSGTVTTSPTTISTGTNTRPSVGNVTSVQLLAANSSRRYAYISNQTGNPLYITLGAAAVAHQAIPLPNGGIYSINSTNLWTGTVNAISGVSSGTVNVDVFEGTP